MEQFVTVLFFGQVIAKLYEKNFLESSKSVMQATLGVRVQFEINLKSVQVVSRKKVLKVLNSRTFYKNNHIHIHFVIAYISIPYYTRKTYTALLYYILSHTILKKCPQITKEALKEAMGKARTTKIAEIRENETSARLLPIARESELGRAVTSIY